MGIINTWVRSSGIVSDIDSHMSRGDPLVEVHTSVNQHQWIFSGGVVATLRWRDANGQTFSYNRVEWQTPVETVLLLEGTLYVYSDSVLSPLSTAIAVRMREAQFDLCGKAELCKSIDLAQLAATKAAFKRSLARRRLVQRAAERIRPWQDGKMGLYNKAVHRIEMMD